MLIKISKSRVKEIIAEEIDRARQKFSPDVLSEGLYDTIVAKGISWSEFSPASVRQKVASAFGITTRMDKSAAANTELENAIKGKSEAEIRAAMSGQRPGASAAAEDDTEQEEAEEYLSRSRKRAIGASSLTGTNFFLWSRADAVSSFELLR